MLSIQKQRKEIIAMVKITCPNCGNQIELDKNSYNELLNDIAGNEVEKRVKEQTKALEATFNAQLALEKQKATNAQNKEIEELKQKNAALEESVKAQLALEKQKSKADSDRELARLEKEKADLKEQLNKQIAILEKEKASLSEKLNNSDNLTQLEVSKAIEKLQKQLIEKEQENSALQESFKAQLALEKERSRADSAKEVAKLEREQADLKERLAKQIAELEKTKASLQEKLNNSDTNTKLEVSKAIEELKEELAEKENKIIVLQGDIVNAKAASELEKKQLKENYDFALEAKEKEIAQWKEFRMGDSTKDIGESLEQYCSDAFNEVRSYAFPNAYFEKDNEVDEEGKGDFIFRDYDGDIEIVSIMFEMKNQKDDTEHKHKNEEFFKKLDKNRTSKGCEYAVLVSTLEENSKLYNNGIVDVSHKYPKMFVVRPQHFITIIGLIRNLALNNVKYKQELIAYKQENVDVTNFEKAVQAVADKINADYDNAGKQYDKVEKMCDDMIKKLQDLKETFRLGQKWLGAAQNQLPNLEIRKLTHGNPTMKAKFEEVKKDKE